MRHVTLQIRLQLMAGLLAALMLAGCGGGKPPQGIIQGEVSFDGKPVPDGRIQFEDVTGVASSAGGKIENGTYRVVSPLASMKIRIVAYREVPGKFLEMNPGVKTPFIEQYIPKKYNEDTELTAEVKQGKQSLDFKLQK